MWNLWEMENTNELNISCMKYIKYVLLSLHMLLRNIDYQTIATTSPQFWQVSMFFGLQMDLRPQHNQSRLG